MAKNFSFISIFLNIFVIIFFTRKFLVYRKSEEKTHKSAAPVFLLLAILTVVVTIGIILLYLGFIQ